MHPHHSLALIATSDVMRSILGRIDTIATSDSSVLLIGETGVGKELIAEYIHRTGPRSDKPLVKVGLSALPPELLESELFGHERGAYTSAASEKKGLFELADTGSIFLDDIDDFPIALQAKLLRVLESREVMRVGGTTPIPIDVRLITATKVDLKELVNRGVFRSDLYYRINVVPLVIPPLRERKDDIPPIIHHFLQRYAPDKQINVAGDALRTLVDYSWPGNIRELRNVVQRMALFADGEIQLKDLPPEVREDAPLDMIAKACQRCFTEENMTFDQVVACLETNLLRQALREANGNRTHAAKALGMSLSTLRDKLKKHNIE
ncbi:sigma-54-dependent Fis family transcriptional regulator [Sphingobacteriales bacterium CHB3]|nr:sigma-54-dependent Fis family transcriptional regulator [Sphingobacteriales bacterium CHB3]